MINFVKVGLKITKYRKEQNLTQDDIAEKLFVSRQLVSKWENGLGVPTIDTILELCEIFHVTFEDLLCLNEDDKLDEHDIFKGYNRQYIIQKIINGEIQVNLADVLYQLSPAERMMLLKAIKTGQLKCEYKKLASKLTLEELAFLRKDEEK